MTDHSFRKKLLVIEAFQMTREHGASNEHWPEWLHRAWNEECGKPGALWREESSESTLAIGTLEGPVSVSWDDWIIRGVKAELYPCKPEIFAATYEPAIGRAPTLERLTPARASSSAHREGLETARLLMVLSSISPLFILWAIRGNSLIPDRYFIGFCALMVVVPNAFLWLRIRIAKKQADKRELTVGTADDHRDHILMYLFAMLMPFYSEDLGSWRALVTALAFIVFLFWHLNLHYMNPLFVALGFRVFMVYPPADSNPLTGKASHAVITRRVSLASGDRLVAYRLTNTVYLETEGGRDD